MSIWTTLKRQATPPTPLAGRLAGQSLLFSTGEGAFLAGSAVFFTQAVGLSGAQIGLGLTLAGVAAFLAAYPLGRLADRIGPKRAWAISAAGQGAMYAVWPFIDNFAGYLAMAVVMEVVGSLGGAAHGAYTIDVLPPAERVRSRAYMYSALNVGFTLGALLCGIVLAFESVALLNLIPVLSMLAFVTNAWFITRLPKAPHDLKTAEERRARVPGPGPLRNIGWLSTAFFGGVMWTNQVLLHLVIPLWLVQRTDAPWVIVAFLFGTNTVMCIVLPMAAARGIKDNATALRAVRISALFFVVTCAITLATHETVGVLTIVLFFVGHVTLTGGELFLSASSWTFEAELMDPRRRGEYQGASELGGTLGRVWAPAVYTFLALSWGAAGWVVIAAIVTVAAIALHPSVRHARAFIEQHVPADVLADATVEAAQTPAEEALVVGPPSLTATDAPLPESPGDLHR